LVVFIIRQMAVGKVRVENMDVGSHDIARFSPLMHQPISSLGRYTFTLLEPIAND